MATQDKNMWRADEEGSAIDDVVTSLCSQRQRTARRVLRSALRNRDTVTLRRMLVDVDVCDVVNSALSDALMCSALSYAARCGYLEVVEALTDMPGCHIDRLDPTKRSALDEAIGAWSAAAAQENSRRRQHDCGKQYRIVRRLLIAGARSLSRPALDVILSSALDRINGQHFVQKLIKVKLDAYN